MMIDFAQKLSCIGFQNGSQEVDLYNRICGSSKTEYIFTLLGTSKTTISKLLEF